MIRINTFRATKSGAWRGGGSYSDSLYRSATDGGCFGPQWELGYVWRAGIRVNVRVCNRHDPLKRIAKILDGDHRWLAVDLSDSDWENMEMAEGR